MIGLIHATAAGRTGCERLAAAWPGRTVLYGDGADRPLRSVVATAFAECDQLVLFLATGAAVRLLAPLLRGKAEDPGVVTVDEAHRHAVALLGGHGGGANALASAVSSVLGSAPVITTATDSVGTPALDALPYPTDGPLAPLTRALLDGAPVRLHADQTWPLPAFPLTVVSAEWTPAHSGEPSSPEDPQTSAGPRTAPPPSTIPRPPDAADSGEPTSPEDPQTLAGHRTAPPNTAVPRPPDAADSGEPSSPEGPRTSAGQDQPSTLHAEPPTQRELTPAPPNTAIPRPPDAADSGEPSFPEGPRTSAGQDQPFTLRPGPPAQRELTSAPPNTAVPRPADAADSGEPSPPEDPRTVAGQDQPSTLRPEPPAQRELTSAPPNAAVPRPAGAGGYAVWVTDRVVEGDEGGVAVYVRPPSLVVGVGGSRGVGREEVFGLVRSTLAEAGLAQKSVSALATVDAKAGEEGIVAAAAEFGVPLLTYAAAELARTAVPNPSAAPLAAVGTPSVAEAAAILAAGTGGQLIVEKRKSAMATAAIARRRPRGRLAVVGLGPGARDLVTPRAVAELRRASVIVGLDQYVDQIRDLLMPGTRVLETGLGAEEERARTAVAEARAGHAVALIGSGDAGVYAMASPALAEAADDIDVIGVPGVTAALAAAALLGAPLGHDHVSISLSDLHTPWDVIERRVRAAAESDLVVTFYNPRSRGRAWQLPKALSVLAEHRTPLTPVGVVHAASRPDERVEVTTLADLDVGTVDMVTVVTVGNTASRIVSGRMVTPRGYRWQT
ncbi:precorrin-3B C(17)-methyltransferase [Streptomyces sp. NPDC088910]|uniref:precorrin-3B C(17)-methyltransferase n=1 Tax=Streptomyces sp. NPDC088910 TaxID=3365911 RepID=UPI0038307A5D